ncbi:hypothetical protein DACRYDRAFT_115054 [Dacryopinax primogenitus]|uniref:Rad9-domain-containing protein n=1 Tax=Dacryopinax primogenitus (strain DJM 731) TaxID=1858805 RepID=M5GC77_DACPD|nr:uncharacterized protein DACRYDRAFT_115054 [Dacryopinax primogenitus]EJU03702.1 hypothetical protein DACRYDRAFT_115054 [Dacryopinax primogenitus]
MASVKTLVKALTCLSRYSDDMDILAFPSSLTLSATNSSKSAYCRLVLQPTFFSSYSVRKPRTGSSLRSSGTQTQEGRSVKARLKTKLLLSHLRHRNHDKGARRVKLIIREPAQNGYAEDEDQSDDEDGRLESRMLVKIFCDHGVVKQHRLNLEYPDELLAPFIEEDPQKKTVVAKKTSLKNLLERMRVGISKADGQISCDFNPADMVVKTIADKGDICTEVKAIGEDLDRYETGPASVSLSFHIREFAATITLAESLDKNMTMNFTEAPAPLVLGILPTELDVPEDETWDFQAFIATSSAAEVVRPNGPKRTRADNDGRPPKLPRVAKNEEENEPEAPVQPEAQWGEDPQQQGLFNDDDMNFEVPVASPPRRATGCSQCPSFQMPASQVVPSGTFRATSRASTFRVPPQHLPSASASAGGPSTTNLAAGPQASHQKEPLFLPPSQLSQAAKTEIFNATGMDDDDLQAFLDMEDDYMDNDPDGYVGVGNEPARKPSVADQSVALGPTLPPDGAKPFHPVFRNSILDMEEDTVVEDDQDFVAPPTQHTTSAGRKKFTPIFRD